MLFLNFLRVLGVLRSLLFNRKERRERKGFGNDSHTNAIPQSLCDLSVLRGLFYC